MTGLERALLRFLGVWTVVAGVELLERVAYRAGATDGAADLMAERDRRSAASLDEAVRAARVAADEDQGDELDELWAVDLSDVVAAHAGCCGTPE